MGCQGCRSPSDSACSASAHGRTPCWFYLTGRQACAGQAPTGRCAVSTGFPHPKSKPATHARARMAARWPGGTLNPGAHPADLVQLLARLDERAITPVCQFDARHISVILQQAVLQLPVGGCGRAGGGASQLGQPRAGPIGIGVAPGLRVMPLQAGGASLEAACQQRKPHPPAGRA